RQSRCNDTSGASVFRWILSEPLDDAWHIRFKGARRREVEDARANGSAILEVMRHAARHENESALRTLEPLLAHAEAHYAFDDIEELVCCVRVRPRPLGFRLEPPFRY